jgi:transmembrane sensor
VNEPIDNSGLMDPALQDRAMDWVLLLRSGQATTDDAEALQRWRHQSDLHEQAFVQAARMFRDLGALGAQLERRNLQPFSTRVSAGARQMVSRRGFIGGAIAASAAGYMVVNPPLGMWPSLVELSADYRTAKGEQRDVQLADNVSVKLNTQTSLSVRSEGNTARVELITGEAAVTAKRDASDPLIVTAANGSISSTNAEFNVRCIDGAVLAICMDGAVTVSQNGRSVQLLRGQQVAYSSTQAIGAAAPVADAERATAWREKLLIFRDQPLAGVVSEVNRYRPGKIVVTNGDLGQRLVNGTFHTDKLDDFVAQVRQLFGADVRSLPGGIVLLS